MPNTIVQQATQIINQTQKHIFLTGKAGTGKTTFLRSIINETHKKALIVAPTGIAALNAGGTTIHSQFQLPTATFIPTNTFPEEVPDLRVENRHTLMAHLKMNKTRRQVLEDLELLIIDEVSMLRADVLDAIEFILQTIRNNKSSFGGVQVLFIGDLLQLPPIVKREEQSFMRQYYPSLFFFNAWALREHPPIYVELEKVHRQTDEAFIDVLNHLRTNTIQDHHIKLLNQYHKPHFKPQKDEQFITLTPFNKVAYEINNQALNQLSTKSYQYHATVQDNFPESMYPCDATLLLKEGAQVMFIKNDLSPEKQYYNGKLGLVKELKHDKIVVYCPDNKQTITVSPYLWENVHYTIHPQTKEIEKEVLGTFLHYPIRLAWAITIHKSQGLTFDRAIVDIGQVFMPGQAYVALSRLRSLDGLILKHPIDRKTIPTDREVLEFAKKKTPSDALESIISDATLHYLANFLSNAFNFEPLYEVWRAHVIEYVSQPERKIFAEQQLEKIRQLKQHAHTFQNQLQYLTHPSLIDFKHIIKRLEASITFFEPALYALCFETLERSFSASKQKGTKIYVEGLMTLESKTYTTLIGIHKALFFMEHLQKQVLHSKLSWDQYFDHKKRLDFIEQLKLKYEQEQLFQANTGTKTPSKAPKKTPKTPKEKDPLTTLERTQKLFLEHRSIEKVAQERSLVTGTIEGHLLKLIQAGQLQVEDVLTPDKISAYHQLAQRKKDDPEATIFEQCTEIGSYKEYQMAVHNFE